MVTETNEHPTGFHTIGMQINLKSDNVNSEDMTKATDLIKGICPVLSMLDSNIKVIIDYNVSD